MNKNLLKRNIRELQAEEGVMGWNPPNKTTLEKFSEDAGSLLWDGAPIAEGGSGSTTIAGVEGLQEALDGKAALEHTHSIEQVVGLSTALDGKAPTEHTHSIAQVNGLEDALNSKADSSELHTHANKAVLDKLGEDSGSLTYDGNAIGGGGGATSTSELTDFPSYGTDNNNQLLGVNVTYDVSGQPTTSLQWKTVESGGGGAEVISDLTDVPEYTNNDNGKVLAVNVTFGVTGAEKELVWATPESGAETFLELSDTPSAYTDNAGKLVAVNSTEDGLEYIDAPSGGGGSTVGAWQSFTPTIRSGSFSNYTKRVGRYRDLGHSFQLYIEMTWYSSPSTPENAIILPPPFYNQIDFQGLDTLALTVSPPHDMRILLGSNSTDKPIYALMRANNGWVMLKDELGSAKIESNPRGFIVSGMIPKL